MRYPPEALRFFHLNNNTIISLFSHTPEMKNIAYYY